MADIDKAALRNRVLEHLNVIAAGATPTTADQALVEEAIDAAWQRLRKLELVNFGLDEIPEYAQKQLRDYVSFDVAPSYGVSGQRLLELRAGARDAEGELNRQTSGSKQKRVRRGVYF